MAASASRWPLERCEPQAVGLCPQRLQRVGELLGRAIDARRVAGTITLVARRGKIAHLQCHGLMDLEERLPMREDAIFRIYSMSKIITSAAVLMLLEEGRFLLAQPVRDFLPEFKQLRVAATGADGKDEPVRPRRDVTIHDLLTHTGGLTYALVHTARDQGWTLQKYVEEVCKLPLKCHPGEAWNYSGSCDVLGRLIEVVAGCPFDEFLRKRIFEPLGMADADFWVPPAKVGRFAKMYRPDDSGKLVSVDQLDIGPGLVGRPYYDKPTFCGGGGGLVSTTSDYLRFALMLLNKGEFVCAEPGRSAGNAGGKTGRVRLLGRKTVELMASDHLPPHVPAVVPYDFGFGLGVSVARRLGEIKQLASVGEFGWGGAASTQTWIDPAEDMVTMIMMQYLPRERFWLMDQYKQTVYQAIID